MKIGTLIFGLFFSFIVDSIAQVIAVEEGVVRIDKTETDAQIATLMINDDQLILKEGRKFIKKNLKVNMKKKGKQMMQAKEATINSISPKRGDLTFVMLKENGQDKLALAYALGYDIFINDEEYPAEAANLKNLLRGFLTEYYKTHFEKQLREEEKKLKKLTRQLSANQRQQRGIQKDIEKNRKKSGKEKFQDQKPALENDTVKLQAKADTLLQEAEQLKTAIANTQREIDVARSNISLF